MDGRKALALSVCTHVLFGYGLVDCVDNKIARRLDVVELWSGVGAVAKAARSRSLAAETFDTKDDPEQDVLTKTGFELALELVLRIRAGGLLWMAPVCSSFCWLNAARHKRTSENQFVGDLSYKKVVQGNGGADVAAFLFALAWARGVEVSVENPPGSAIWKYPTIAKLLASMPLVPTVANRCRFDPNPYGARYLKEYKFWATGDWVRRVGRKCTCPDRIHKHTVNRKGAAVTGRTADLVATQSYPPSLGVAIVDAWLGQGSEVPGLPSGGDGSDDDAAPRIRRSKVPLRAPSGTAGSSAPRTRRSGTAVVTKRFHDSDDEDDEDDDDDDDDDASAIKRTRSPDGDDDDDDEDA